MARYQLFMIGLDFMVDESGKVKILEIQHIFNSYSERAHQLTGKDPVARLRAVINRAYPELIRKLDAATP